MNSKNTNGLVSYTASILRVLDFNSGVPDRVSTISLKLRDSLSAKTFNVNHKAITVLRDSATANSELYLPEILYHLAGITDEPIHEGDIVYIGAGWITAIVHNRTLVSCSEIIPLSFCHFPISYWLDASPYNKRWAHFAGWSYTNNYNDRAELSHGEEKLVLSGLDRFREQCLSYITAPDALPVHVLRCNRVSSQLCWIDMKDFSSSDKGWYMVYNDLIKLTTTSIYSPGPELRESLPDIILETLEHEEFENRDDRQIIRAAQDKLAWIRDSWSDLFPSLRSLIASYI